MLFRSSKVAFSDPDAEMTFDECQNDSKRIGTFLTGLEGKNKPIAVIMPKNVQSLTCFFGVVYSGNFYVVIDEKMPIDRIPAIFSTLQPIAIITDKAHAHMAEHFEAKTYYYEDVVTTDINQVALEHVRSQMIDTDPLYALFTSGSTGVPKGAILSHRNVINYASWYKET